MLLMAALPNKGESNKFLGSLVTIKKFSWPRLLKTILPLTQESEKLVGSRSMLVKKQQKNTTSTPSSHPRTAQKTPVINRTRLKINFHFFNTGRNDFLLMQLVFPPTAYQCPLLPNSVHRVINGLLDKLPSL